MVYTCLTLITSNPISKRRLILDDACWEMRHDLITIIGQPFRGCDHVLNRCAVDMCDVYAGTCGQKVFEVFNLFGCARHDFDRIVLQKGRNIGVYAQLRFFPFHKGK